MPMADQGHAEALDDTLTKRRVERIAPVSDRDLGAFPLRVPGRGWPRP